MEELIKQLDTINKYKEKICGDFSLDFLDKVFADKQVFHIDLHGQKFYFSHRTDQPNRKGDGRSLADHYKTLKKEILLKQLPTVHILQVIFGLMNN